MYPDNSIPAITGNLEYCYREESEGACYNPDVSLRDEHLEKLIAYDEEGIPVATSFYKHVAHCNPCMGRLLCCARNRRCESAWTPLTNAVNVLADEQVSKRRGLGQWSDEARDFATIHAYRVVLKGILTTPDSLPAYTNAVLRSSLSDWWQSHQRELELTEILGDVFPQSLGTEDPLSIVIAKEQLELLAQVLLDFQRYLTIQKPLHAELFQLYSAAKLAEPTREPNQSRLSEALAMQGISKSQETVSNWLKWIKLKLIVALHDPNNGLAPETRDYAITFFAQIRPRRARHERVDDKPPEVPDDTNPETGDPHE